MRIGKIQIKVLKAVYKHETKKGKWNPYSLRNPKEVIYRDEIVKFLLRRKPLRMRERFEKGLSKQAIWDDNHSFYRDAKSIYRAIQTLEREGLLVRHKNKYGVSRCISLTETGRRIISHRLTA